MKPEKAENSPCPLIPSTPLHRMSQDDELSPQAKQSRENIDCLEKDPKEQPCNCNTDSL